MSERPRRHSSSPEPSAALMTATEILPKLFLGGRTDAESLGARVPEDWACISVTEYRSRYKRQEELPHEPDGSLDMPFLVDWPNGWHADPHKLNLIAETIWWRLQIGKKVLVHCIHAQERAPLTIAWYLAWSGASPSILRAYETVAKRHPRTERRDKWLRGAEPKKLQPELPALLNAARALEATDSRLRAEAARALEATDSRLRADTISSLETAALAWAAAEPRGPKI